MGWCCARHGGSGKEVPQLLLLLLLLLASSASLLQLEEEEEEGGSRARGGVAASKPYAWNLHYSQSLALVKPAPLLLPYHNGPVLSGGGEAVEVHVLWYGDFTAAQKAIVLDFLASFGAGDEAVGVASASSSSSGHSSSSSSNSSSSGRGGRSGGGGNATAAGGRRVSEWWSTTRGYRDASGAAAAPGFRVASQAHDRAMALGKTLTPRDVERLLFFGDGDGGDGDGGDGGDGGGDGKKKRRRRRRRRSWRSLHALFTAPDVYVDGFCLNSCGFHAYTFPGAAEERMLPYLWLGNAAAQCPGQCAWPFAAARYGPRTAAPPLRPPNADLGADAMVVVLATLLAGAATNPFGTGFFQGDASAPLEAASACSGIFGPGAFPGYPGELLTHAPSGSSFNARGAAGRRFLLPAIWNPASLDCLPL